MNNCYDKKNNKPKLVNDISNGFYQSKECIYYYGVSDKIDVGTDSTACVALYNPFNSNKIIYMNKLSCANYSSSPIIVDVYADAKIEGKLKSSTGIANGNTKYSCKEINIGKILFGKDITLSTGKNVYSRSIPGYETSEGFPNGSIILYPGNLRTYLIKSSCSISSSLISVSFTWWEENLHCPC